MTVSQRTHRHEWPLSDPFYRVDARYDIECVRAASDAGEARARGLVRE
jgi:hypothetical protein